MDLRCAERLSALIDEGPVLLPCHSLHGPLLPLPSETGAAPAGLRLTSGQDERSAPRLAGSPAAAAGGAGMGTAAAARSSPRPPPGGVSPSTCLPHALTPADVYRAGVPSERAHVVT